MSDERLDLLTCYMKRDEHGELCGDPVSINVNQIHRRISGFASVPKHMRINQHQMLQALFHRFSLNPSGGMYGSFRSHGGTPIAGWFIMENS